MSSPLPSQWRKLGIVAGSGELPVLIAEACTAQGRSFVISRLGSNAHAALDKYGGHAFEVGEIGSRFDALKHAGVDAVTLVGNLARPDFKSLKLDARGAILLPKVVIAARRGDDALLSVIVEEFERSGFNVIGAQDIAGELLAPAGLIAGPVLDEATLDDIKKGAAVAATIGGLDIGQGCVVCSGLVLAVEAQEGTDAMLQRVAGLPARIRGSQKEPLGALVKRPKPTQELRVDLPTIGLATIEHAAQAGLRSVAFEAGVSLLLQREACIAAANRLDISLYGFSPEEVAG
ncbi:MAG: UDP-2,3-diacylglucosamine diphosphatase LpxI [Caulobacterales bacterium]